MKELRGPNRINKDSNKRWEFRKLEKLGEKWEAEGKRTEEELKKELKRAREKFMKEPGEQKIEKKETWVMGPKEKYESLGNVREAIEKGKPPEKEPKKTPEEIEKTRKIIEKILEKGKEEKKIERGKIETRPEAIEEIVSSSKKFGDLVGNNSAEAWAKREKLLKINNPRITKEVLRTLAGLPDPPEVWETLALFKDIDKNQPYWRTLCEALIGKTSEAAEEMRTQIEVDPKANQGKGAPRGGKWLKWINRLGLQKSEGFFKLRKEIDKRLRIGWFLPSDVVLSEMGINTPEDNKRRTAYKDIAPAEALISTAGIKPGKSPEVDAIRRELALEPGLRWAYDLAVKGNNYEKN